jgi:predicted nucleotidyltransferase
VTALGVSRDRPVDPGIVAAIADVVSAARGADIDHFLGGALARDLILFHVYGQPTGRITRDVDLMLCVDSWEAYSSFRAQLLSGGAFCEDSSQGHRLWHGGEPPKGVPLDILPFGSLEDPAGKIAWPPDGTVLMTVTGFAEALSTAISVAVAEGVVVAVATLPALAVTKLAAWLDRHTETDKDAVDLRVILQSYHAAGNEDRLYGPEAALLAEEGFDPQQAGARLLGRDAVSVSGTVVGQIVTRFGIDDRNALRRQILASPLQQEDDPGMLRTERLLSSFWQELQRAQPRSG